MGFDNPRNMGGYAYGGTIVAPIIKDLIRSSRDHWSDLPPVAPEGIRMVRVDRRTGKRVQAGWPSRDGNTDIIWEAFKPDTEPERSTRQDEIAAKRDEILALIQAGREGGGQARRAEGEPENFAEEQGGDLLRTTPHLQSMARCPLYNHIPCVNRGLHLPGFWQA